MADCIILALGIIQSSRRVVGIANAQPPNFFRFDNTRSRSSRHSSFSEMRSLRVVNRIQKFSKSGRPYSTAVGLSESDAREHSESFTYARPYCEVPGPKGLPIIGNSWRFLPFIGHYQLPALDKVMESLYRDYGEIVKISGLIGHPDLLFIFNPNEIERIFKREETMPHRPSMPSVKYYKQVLHKEFFGKNTGVVGVHGQQWDDFRSKVHQTMMQPNTAKKYLGPLNQITAEFLERVEEKIKDDNELDCDFMEELYKWALECIGKVALDTKLGCLNKNLEEESEAQRMIESVKTFFANVAQVELRMPVWRVYSTPSWKKYIGAFDMFRETCLKYINEALVKLESRNGMVDGRKEEDIPLMERILLKTKDPKVATVLALDLLLVGIDTTSVAATTIIYHLAKNPEKQDKLYRELQTLLPNEEDPITEKTISQSVFLSACIKESLRMKPVIIGNGRSLTSNAVIGNYMIPKGTHVIFPHYVVGNLSQYFSEPEKFIPERWLKESDEVGKCPHEHKIHRFASLPFGYGRRTCLGRRFAEAELKILLSKVFRKYKVTYEHGEMKYEVQSTYKSPDPVLFHFKKRQMDANVTLTTGGGCRNSNPVQVASFSWSDCGVTTQPVKIMSLDVFVNESRVLYITGRGKLAENLTSPIQANVEMSKKFFWGWTKVPCLDNVGSCNYEDVCALSPYHNCPEDFIKNSLPCKCPILEGQYAAKKFPLDLKILPKWIESGDYRIKIKLNKNNEELMCILLYIQL